MRSRDIFCKYCRPQPVRCAVCSRNGFLLGLKFVDHDKWPKYFFLVDPIVVLHVNEDGWGDKISLFSMGYSSMDESSTLRFSSLNIRQDTFILLSGDLRALEGIFGKRISNDRDLFGFLFECFDKLELYLWLRIELANLVNIFTLS